MPGWVSGRDFMTLYEPVARTRVKVVSVSELKPLVFREKTHRAIIKGKLRCDFCGRDPVYRITTTFYFENGKFGRRKWSCERHKQMVIESIEKR
ncbi:MAG TPA: hypothetical protein ENN28_04010 [Candidatus Uhrbacteria bacterium]|nr:hypothetical protein [Candidatus Uhrbacteria bacterium]